MTSEIKAKKNILIILKKVFKEKLLNTKIRKNISISKSKEKNIPVYIYNKESNSAKDFLSLQKK